METVFKIVKQFIFLLIFFQLLLEMIPKGSLKKYIEYFSKLLIVLVLLNGIIKNKGMEDKFLQSIETYQEKIQYETYKNTLVRGEEQNSAKVYELMFKNTCLKDLETEGLKVKRVDVTLEENMKMKEILVTLDYRCKEKEEVLGKIKEKWIQEFEIEEKCIGFLWEG